MHDSQALQYERRLQERALEVDPHADVDGNTAILNILRLANVVGEDFEKHIHRPRGSTRAGFKVMLAVWVMGPLSQTDLARYSNVTAASISSVLNKLERAGMIQRTRSETDRRTVTIELTEAGTESTKELYRLHLAREAAWLDGLSTAEKVLLAKISRDLLSHRPSLPDDSQPTTPVSADIG
ncbi:MarR family winged helix-turn-helix transcriptional regulator [Nocardia rhizosphaerihabitans]|uniref:HTH marR-type domain-containing protein n=1 Tax=Nocardia rhizosphaerihabitans TaxID=1691570 RepID=A0ABQ2KCX5_9NOCA|nr:MarR family transcriptional regulator [Nocardia rhizosphaerihabitans]GGN78678.1 hypothetical protein GCM10011610_26500 [Nocardia rhizosphaerihabitans]